MTDLTTMHLKCLLEKAAPGPWESSAVVDALCKDWDSYLLHLYMGNTCLSQVSSVQYEDESYESLNLAAHAPELAQEVINLRDALGYLVGETRLAAENSDDVVVQKRVADAIKTTVAKIQGDHDE